MSGERFYAAIDLKSFYASVECIERELDPMKTNLVVADQSRTDKTICLAVSPPLKAMGVPGRPRLFEVVQKVQQINALRKEKAPGRQLSGASWDADALAADPCLAVDYIVAPPRMSHYMEHSAFVYQTYLKYVAPEDIHVYSVDEVFIDISPYLKTSGLSPRAFVQRILVDVLKTTGITAAAGIGTNLYLCKVAMDIMAKRTEPDEFGVRIAELDEGSYRRQLWAHRPITDFWRVGVGYARRLEKLGIYTMGDIARCSLGRRDDFYNGELLYRTFGINAELLIDHAWGWEPCTIADIRAYRPETNSICSGQVLHCPYSYEKAKLITREMADLLALDLVDKGLVTDQLVLSVGYDIENLEDPQRRSAYRGAVVTDHYGRKVPKHGQGTVNLPMPTASSREIAEAFVALFEQIADPQLLVRRLNLTAAHVTREGLIWEPDTFVQMDMFAQPEDGSDRKKWRVRERSRQEAILKIKKRFGKNAIVKGMNLEEGATAMDRNRQIGGHKA